MIELVRAVYLRRDRDRFRIPEDEAVHQQPNASVQFLCKVPAAGLRYYPSSSRIPNKLPHIVCCNPEPHTNA